MHKFVIMYSLYSFNTLICCCWYRSLFLYPENTQEHTIYGIISNKDNDLLGGNFQLIFPSLNMLLNVKTYTGSYRAAIIES